MENSRQIASQLAEVRLKMKAQHDQQEAMKRQQLIDEKTKKFQSLVAGILDIFIILPIIKNNFHRKNYAVANERLIELEQMLIAFAKSIAEIGNFPKEDIKIFSSEGALYKITDKCKKIETLLKEVLKCNSVHLNQYVNTTQEDDLNFYYSIRKKIYQLFFHFSQILLIWKNKFDKDFIIHEQFLIYELPYELWQKIALHLSFEDLINLDPALRNTEIKGLLSRPEFRNALLLQDNIQIDQRYKQFIQGKIPLNFAKYQKDFISTLCVNTLEISDPVNSLEPIRRAAELSSMFKLNRAIKYCDIKSLKDYLSKMDALSLNYYLANYLGDCKWVKRLEHSQIIYNIFFNHFKDLSNRKLLKDEDLIVWAIRLNQREFLQNKEEIIQKDNFTLVNVAAEYGHIQIVNLWKQLFDFDFHQPAAQGERLILNIALINRQFKLVEYLLKADEDQLASGGSFGQLAYLNQSITIAIEELFSLKQTSLDLAILAGEKEIAKRLLMLGAKSANPLFLLTIIVARADWPMLEYLLNLFQQARARIKTQAELISDHVLLDFEHDLHTALNTSYKETRKIDPNNCTILLHYAALIALDPSRKTHEASIRILKWIVNVMSQIPWEKRVDHQLNYPTPLYAVLLHYETRKLNLLKNRQSQQFFSFALICLSYIAICTAYTLPSTHEELIRWFNRSLFSSASGEEDKYLQNLLNIIDLILTAYDHDKILFHRPIRNKSTPLHLIVELNFDELLPRLGLNDNLINLYDRGAQKSQKSLKTTGGLYAQDVEGNTPLHIACQNQNLNFVKALLQTSAGRATAIIVNNDGKTPLYIACEEENTEILALLLEMPNLQDVVNLKSKDEKTILDVLIEENDSDSTNFIKSLLEAGAKLCETQLFNEFLSGKYSVISTLMRLLDSENFAKNLIFSEDVRLFLSTKLEKSRRSLIEEFIIYKLKNKFDLNSLKSLILKAGRISPLIFNTTLLPDIFKFAERGFSQLAELIDPQYIDNSEIEYELYEFISLSVNHFYELYEFISLSVTPFKNFFKTMDFIKKNPIIMENYLLILVKLIKTVNIKAFDQSSERKNLFTDCYLKLTQEIKEEFDKRGLGQLQTVEIKWTPFVLFLVVTRFFPYTLIEKYKGEILDVIETFIEKEVPLLLKPNINYPLISELLITDSALLSKALFSFYPSILHYTIINFHMNSAFKSLFYKVLAAIDISKVLQFVFPSSGTVLQWAIKIHREVNPEQYFIINNKTVIKHLIRSGARLCTYNEQKLIDSCLHQAIRDEKYELIPLLIQAIDAHECINLPLDGLTPLKILVNQLALIKAENNSYKKLVLIKAIRSLIIHEAQLNEVFNSFKIVLKENYYSNLKLITQFKNYVSSPQCQGSLSDAIILLLKSSLISSQQSKFSFFNSVPLFDNDKFLIQHIEENKSDLREKTPLQLKRYLKNLLHWPDLSLQMQNKLKLLINILIKIDRFVEHNKINLFPTSNGNKILKHVAQLPIAEHQSGHEQTHLNRVTLP